VLARVRRRGGAQLGIIEPIDLAEQVGVVPVTDVHQQLVELVDALDPRQREAAADNAIVLRAAAKARLIWGED
jgi:hypothetical protein